MKRTTGINGQALCGRMYLTETRGIHALQHTRPRYHHLCICAPVGS